MDEVVFVEEIQLFDTPHVVVGRSVAKPVGIMSKKDIDSFFRALEGRRNYDWFFISGGIRIEWYDHWNTIEYTNSPSFYRILPVDAVPANTLSARQAKYDSMRSKPIPRSEIKGDWFSQHTQRLTGESDFEFEHRMVKTFATLFRIIQKHNPIKTSP